MEKKRFFEQLWDGILILFGTALFALSTYYFITLAEVAPGGVSGIAILVNHLFDAPIGLVSAAINFPLLVIGWRRLGKEFLWKTLISVAAFTVFHDYVLVPLNLPVYEGDRLLACLFGGVLMGAGLGIVFYCAGSTGGTDIVTKLLQKKFPHIQLGRLMLMLDLIVILASVFVFGSVEAALYAVIVIFVCSQLIDVVVYSGDKGKLIYIFSSHYREISDEIIQKLDRGVTLLKGEGGYTGKDCQVVLCALRTSEYHRVKKIIRRIDPDAFVIVSDSSEVMGEGFKSVEHD
ncbi:MAG: YitT family protein [Oscillospiraceae bacterium]|nr:YitT family protein [Oscillospiraceae bacterium]